MSLILPDALKPGTNGTRELRFDVVRDGIDEQARTVEMAFSSETPVDRWWGIEVLDHRAKSIRTDRLQSAGPVLMDHDTRDQVGVIQSVQIGKDKVARAVVRFGKSARASEIFQDVVDGIRSNVSVGYVIHDVELESETDGVGTYRVTDWEPYELSLVSVPADIKVGVGRAADQNPATGAKPMNDVVKPDPVQPDNSAALAAARSAGLDGERKRVAEITAIVDQYGKYDLGKVASEAVRGGMSVDEFRAKALDVIASNPTRSDAKIGLDVKEVKRYSIVRALNALANPTDPRARAAAAFEMECSEAAATRAGKTAQGLMVPYDVLTRGLTVGTATAGGNLVETDILSGDFISILRNAMVITRMGARSLAGLQGNIAIPRQSGAGTAFWVAEGVAPATSQQAFDQVPLIPKTVGAFTDISRKLLIQSSIDVESLVQSDLATILGLEIQRVAINGGGVGEPVGILGNGSVAVTALGANGLAPAWGDIVALETAVAVGNADIGTLGYLANAKGRGKLKNTQKLNATNGIPVWADGNTPLNGYQAGVTNGVPSNLTKGTSAGICSAIIFGNFADLIIGMWGGLDLTVDPYSLSTTGAVRVVVLQDVDVAIRHPESFAVIKDALTT
jgi:HK97 family phage major capsid protein/HK97 family phage prohead protease